MRIKKIQDYSDRENELIRLFEQHQNDLPILAEQRQKAINQFAKTGIPNQSLENWRSTNLDSIVNELYQIDFQPKTDIDIASNFRCIIDGLDAYEIQLINGFVAEKKLTNLSNGLIFGSLLTASQEYPELVLPYFQNDIHALDGFSHLNSAFWSDGLFVYLPENVKLEKPIQLVNIYNPSNNSFVNIRNLIIAGKNSQLTLIHCDDSVNHQKTLSNVHTEVFSDDNSDITYFKLQNINNDTTLINRIFFDQQAYSNLTFNQVSLNGGILRNDIFTYLKGSFAKADLSGLYLMDKSQHIDNQVFLRHEATNCISNQRFKGILDDYAGAVFNGHVLVDKGAQKTEAMQNCRNILLTDKAKVEAKPFLEIYADDVKCGHGASVGQLDNESMFYLRSRGISIENARMLLMYAFAAEVVEKIGIEPLRERYSDMIKRRLSGELMICANCVLNCSHQDKKYEFEIKL
ncbi:MAG: Fe-S cluster assembly protein SufD [Bacteroidales bacterium]|nr:Fe-S cluster assembly protein SufD [Bacteroidales bacterium]